MAETESKDKKINMKEALQGEADSQEDVSALSEYHVKQESFEGPFDLLLHMIDEEELDIYKVSLSQVIKGFIEYLNNMKELNIIIASEFLLMAAYLIEMKSKMLLPVPEEPEEEENLEEIEKTLLDRLHEYKVFKELAVQLKERKAVFGKTYARKVVDDAYNEEQREVFLTDVSLKDLLFAFQKVWKEVESRGTTGEIVDEHITLPEKISEIVGKLKKMKGGLPFDQLFTRFVKFEVVITFLAILELARQRKIQIKQGDVFGSILIFGRENK